MHKLFESMYSKEEHTGVACKYLLMAHLLSQLLATGPHSSATVHINLADSRPVSENRAVDIREQQTL